MENTQLKIKELCPNQYLEIIKFYWEFDADPLEFRNTPKRVKTKYEIAQPELNNIIQSYSKLTFYFHCKNCNSFEFNEVNSQSAFNKLLREYNSPRDIFKCKHCKKLDYLEIQRKQEIDRQKTLLRLDKAVNEQRWKNLNSFQYKLLDHCISKNFKELQKHYWSKLGKDHYKKLFQELHSLAALDLILLETDTNNYYVIDYAVCHRLKENFAYNPPVKEKSTSTESKFDNIQSLKFKLPVNKRKKHPDDPTHTGATTFSERIIIEPGIEYSFALWERSNDNLYLVLVPTEEIYPSPKVSSLSVKPIHIQEGIRNFMDSINPNSKDW